MKEQDLVILLKKLTVKGSNLSGKIKVKIVGMNADGAEAQIL